MPSTATATTTEEALLTLLLQCHCHMVTVTETHFLPHLMLQQHCASPSPSCLMESTKRLSFLCGQCEDMKVWQNFKKGHQNLMSQGWFMQKMDLTKRDFGSMLFRDKGADPKVWKNKEKVGRLNPPHKHWKSGETHHFQGWDQSFKLVDAVPCGSGDL